MAETTVSVEVKDGRNNCICGSERWPKQLYLWKPPGKRKRGIPNKSWMEEMMTAMQSRGLSIEDAQDRRLWRIGTGRRH
jgi:hypothetical protein